MAVNELIEFLTKEFVTYIQTSQDERQKRKESKKEQRGQWSNHWFGALPMAIGMMVKRRKV